MLNALLKKHGYNSIRAGIGVALGNDCVIKAGRKGVDINSLVWMGEAVSKASKLSGYGGKNDISRIVLSNLAYTNIIDIYKERHSDKNPESWFHTLSSLPYGAARHCDIIMTDMNDWIDEGMPE